MPGISDIGRTFDPRSWVQGTSILDQTFNDKIKMKGQFNKITYRIPDFIGQNFDQQSHIDAVANTVVSRSSNEYKDSTASGVGVNVGFKSIFSIGGDSSHSSVLSSLSVDGTYAYRTTLKVKVFSMHTKGELNKYVNQNLIKDVNNLPDWEDNNPEVKFKYDHFFSKWGGPFYIASGVWGGLINAGSILSNAKSYEEQYSASNVKGSVGASLGPWSFGGSASKSSHSAYSNSNFNSDLTSFISVIGGQPEGNTGQSSQVSTNVQNWGNKEKQEWISDVKLNPSLISFTVKKISTLFSGILRDKLDKGINAIYGTMQHDLNEINKQIAKLSNKIPSGNRNIVVYNCNTIRYPTWSIRWACPNNKVMYSIKRNDHISRPRSYVSDVTCCSLTVAI